MPRNTDLAQIHIAAKALALDDATYRALLQRVAGVDSARDLNPLQRGKVLAEFRRLGWRPRPPKRRPRAAPDRQKLVAKIIAQCHAMALPLTYALAIAQRQTGREVPDLAWLDADELRGIVAALHRKQQKHHPETVP